MENTKGFVFMAFAAGTEIKETTPYKKYIGVAPSYVLGVNLNKKETKEVLDRDLTEEPSFVIEKDGVTSVRLSFVMKPDATVVGEDVSPINMTMFLRKEPRFNKDKSKVQVIDKYGRTAWVTIDQMKNHEIPMYSNGPAKIDKDYRPLYRGEEELVHFLKIYLGIPSIDVYNSTTGQWSTHPNPEDCQASLEKIEDYFKGDFSELKNILTFQPKNRVGVLYGVRTSPDGKEYQDVYTQKFIRPNSSNYTSLEVDVKQRQEQGAYPNTVFEVCNFKEYVVTPTTFGNPTEVKGSESGVLPWEL